MFVSERAMKKLAIFCDGTWNDLSLEAPTNVVRLAKNVSANSAAGVPQIVYYDEGVGVGAGVGRVTNWLTKYVGGALGRGLDRKIEAAYRFLVLNYEEGDEIYVFGFSRGAYTARSLSGLVRKCGILRRDCFNKVPEAIERYRDASHPDHPAMVEFRQRFGHPKATGRADAARLNAATVRPTRQLLPAEAGISERPGAEEDLSAAYQYRSEAFYQIMFVGVWDTVGALGLPARLDVFNWNRRYNFHDTEASSLLTSIRHAVAGNERRGLFDLTPFKNIDSLNSEWAAATGHNVSDPRSPSYVPYGRRPYQQCWLPGDHGDVGGGHANRRLSSSGLLWIARGAQAAGLQFDWHHGELAEAMRERDPCGTIGANATLHSPEGPIRAAGPPTLDEVEESALERWDRDPRYRPRNFTVLFGRGGTAAGAPPAAPPPSQSAVPASSTAPGPAA
jgi:uncharacterized protein (DUF2235 family)